MNLVFLAAGKSSRIFKIFKKPKCLLKIGNKTLIEKLINNFKNTEINKINIVVGSNSNMIKKYLKNYRNIKFIYNKDYSKKEMLYSMILALKKIQDDIIFSYSDIIYDANISKKLSNKKKNIYLPILMNWKKIWNIRKKNILEDAEEINVNKKLQLVSIGKKITNLKKVKYQYMGLIFIPKSKRNLIIKIYNKYKLNNKMHLSSFLNILVKHQVKVKCIKYKGHWYEFDDFEDYKNYKKYFLN